MPCDGSRPPDSSVLAALEDVLGELRELTAASGGLDVARLFELQGHLDELLEASATRCRDLADRLCVFEEHAHLRGPAPTRTSGDATLLARRLTAAR